MLRCRVFGHRYRFVADGTTMTWSCERFDTPGGRKDYSTADEAARFARALEPLRIWRAWRDRR